MHITIEHVGEYTPEGKSHDRQEIVFILLVALVSAVAGAAAGAGAASGCGFNDSGRRDVLESQSRSKKHKTKHHPDPPQAESQSRFKDTVCVQKGQKEGKGQGRVREGLNAKIIVKQRKTCKNFKQKVTNN